jgi:hypothetical protein
MIIIIIRTIRISKIYTLFIRNQITIPRSIYKRNKTLKRPNLGLKTLINLAVRLITPVTLISTLLIYTYNI